MDTDLNLLQENKVISELDTSISSFTITTTTNRSQKGEKDITLTLKVESSSLLMKAFKLLEYDFNANRPSYSKAISARKAFQALQCCSEALAILSKQPLDITGDQLRSAIVEFETYLINTTPSASTRSKNSWMIRTCLANTNLILQDGRTTSEELKSLRSRCKKPRKLFKLNSLVLGDISSIEHLDIEELKSKAREKISSFLNVIEQTCKIIIDDYLKVTEDHRKLKKQCLSLDIREYYSYRLTISDPWNIHFKQPPCGTEYTLLAFILQTIPNSANKSIASVNEFSRLPTLKNFPTILKEKKVWCSSAGSYYNFFVAEYLLPNFVLIAIAVLICQKTGWNPGSVHALSTGDIQKLSETRYLLQSIKSKTDDKTPPYEVRMSSEPLLFRAIELLIWHHKQVTGMFNLSEPRLFIGNNNNQFAVFFPLKKSNIFNNFIAPFDLADFSASDLRPSRAGLMMLTENDIQAVRELLGHNYISTTSIYLKSTLFFQLNEARILEFQRRIDATIIFLDGGEELVASRHMKSQHVDIKLFAAQAIGDGTRCRDPYDSPDPVTEKGALCVGIHCQVNGGCKNNVILVNRTDIELAKKTQIYYRSRWSFLYAKNPKAFAEIHVPKLIFIHVFLAYIQDTRPDLLAAQYA